jgi:hypothetical protein
MTAYTDSADERRSPRRRRRWAIAGVVLAVLAGLTIFVFAYFEPHKLFIDDKVNEPFPVAVGSTTTAPTTAATEVSVTAAASTAPATVPPTTPEATAPPRPVAQATGMFVSLDHGTSGSAAVYVVEDGRRVLRIEDLDTSNGPDVYVYLSANPAAGPEGQFDDAYVNLGGLKGNIGDQNYEIPADVDVTQYLSVVIWCDRFNSAFGAADLVHG